MSDYAWLQAGGRERLELVLRLKQATLNKTFSDIEKQQTSPDANGILAGIVAIAVMARLDLPEDDVTFRNLSMAAYLGRVVSATEKSWLKVPANMTHLAVHTVLAQHASDLTSNAPEELHVPLCLAMNAGYFSDRSGQHPYQVLEVNPQDVVGSKEGAAD